MLRRTAVIVAALMLAGCYDRFDTPQAGGGQLPEPNTTIAHLHSLWFGSVVTIDEDAIIGGRVTSSDREGNFYRTFTVCDGTGGIEIMAGPYDLYNIYPTGCRVSIKLKGCAMDEQYGVLRAGLSAEGDGYAGSVPDYMQSPVILDSRIFRDGPIEEPDIPTLGIGQLDKSLCGCPVTVGHLRHTASERDDDGIWAGYAAFADSEGNEIFVYTNDSASYAAEAVPEQTVSITGILMYGTISRPVGERFIIKMRSLEDCTIHN